METPDPESPFEQLRRQFASADPNVRWKAINRLSADYGPHIERYARVRLGSKMRVLYGASGVMQSVCIRVLLQVRDKPLEFDSEAKLLAYLNTITQNKIADIADYLSTRKRDSENSEDRRDGGPQAVPTPSSKIRGDEWREFLNHFCDKLREFLNSDDWRLCEQFYLDGKPLAQIAVQVQSTPDAVRMRLQRIRRRIKTEFAIDEQWFEE